MLKNRRNKWKMAIKKVGSLSPPHGRYGGLKKFLTLTILTSLNDLGTINRLNGRAIFIRSLGSIGIKKPSSWRNPSNAPPYQTIGTLQSQLTYWKGQKREPRGLCL